MALIARIIDDEPPVSHEARHVLLVLARYADANGVLWLKQAELERRTGIPQRTLRRRLNELDAAGLVERESYLRPDGRQGASTFRISASLLESASAATTADPAETRAATMADLADDRATRAATTADHATAAGEQGRPPWPTDKGGHHGRPEPDLLTEHGGGGSLNEADFDALINQLPQRPTRQQRAELLAAFTENPDGFTATVAQAIAEGKKPLALLLHKVSRGEHRTNTRKRSPSMTAEKALAWLENVGHQYEPTDFEEELERFARRGLSPDLVTELLAQYRHLRATNEGEADAPH